VAPNEFAYTNLANIAFEDKNYGKALTYYEKACGVSPKSDFCWRNIGDCYQALGNRRLMLENYARAADLLTEKLTANPRRGDDWMTLAFYHAKLGRQDQAKSEIRTAEERGATRVDAQFVKAQALAALGNKQEALELILVCLDRGLSPVQADYAMDLKDVRADPRYRKRVAEIASKPPK
jgi:eukaryotic-like serine/threonine-protein kinase